MTVNAADRRVRKTRKQLRLGLAALLKEKSLNDISVRELAEVVDINRATFYIHYKDVFDMVAQIEDEIIAGLRHLLAEHPLEEVRESPQPVLSDVCTYLEENGEICAALLGPNGDLAFLDKIQAQVIESGFYSYFNMTTPDHPGEHNYAGKFALSGCLGVIRTWLIDGRRESAQEVAALTAQLIHCVMASAPNAFNQGGFSATGHYAPLPDEEDEIDIPLNPSLNEDDFDL